MFHQDDVGGLLEFEALSKLFQQAEVIEDAPQPSSISRPGPTPGAVGPKDVLPIKIAAPKVYDSKDIWEESDATDGLDDDVDDGRVVPNHEFIYKQAVASTDAFLGMSSKDPSSTCCEELVVRIELPEASSAAELDLDVKSTHLRLSSSIYKLSVYLPHKVDGERGKAKWDGKKKMLSVTLPIIREDPF